MLLSLSVNVLCREIMYDVRSIKYEQLLIDALDELVGRDNYVVGCFLLKIKKVDCLRD